MGFYYNIPVTIVESKNSSFLIIYIITIKNEVYSNHK